MRILIGFLALAALPLAIIAAPPPPSKPGVPKQGIKTPGIQIPFANITAEATLQAPDKPAWTYFLSDAVGPAGGRGPAVGGRGGRGAGGRGPGTGATPPPAAGFLLIPAKDRLYKIDSRTNKPAEAIANLKQPCGGIVSAFGSLWIPTCGDHALQRLDPKTSKITATIGSGASTTRGSIAASADSIWLLTDATQTLSRIDPDQNAVVGEFRVPPGCSGLTFAEASLWLACPEQNKILRINPATNVVDKRIEVAGRPVSLAAGENSLWVLCAKDGKVDRIDPKTDKVTKSIELLVPNADGVIAFSDNFVWITMPGFPVTRIDPTAETVAQQFWGEGGGGLTAGGGALWLTHLSGPNAGTVWRIDPKLILATLAE
jgi:virginiamycin B lyase